MVVYEKKKDNNFMYVHNFTISTYLCRTGSKYPATEILH